MLNSVLHGVKTYRHDAFRTGYFKADGLRQWRGGYHGESCGGYTCPLGGKLIACRSHITCTVHVIQCCHILVAKARELNLRDGHVVGDGDGKLGVLGIFHIVVATRAIAFSCRVRNLETSIECPWRRVFAAVAHVCGGRYVVIVGNLGLRFLCVVTCSACVSTFDDVFHQAVHVFLEVRVAVCARRLAVVCIVLVQSVSLLPRVGHAVAVGVFGCGCTVKHGEAATLVLTVDKSVLALSVCNASLAGVFHHRCVEGVPVQTCSRKRQDALEGILCRVGCGVDIFDRSRQLDVFIAGICAVVILHVGSALCYLVCHAILEVVVVHVCRRRVIVAIDIECAPFVEHRFPVIPYNSYRLAVHRYGVCRHIYLVSRAVYGKIVLLSIVGRAAYVAFAEAFSRCIVVVCNCLFLFDAIVYGPYAGRGKAVFECPRLRCRSRFVVVVHDVDVHSLAAIASVAAEVIENIVAKVHALVGLRA